MTPHEFCLWLDGFLAARETDVCKPSDGARVDCPSKVG